MTVINITTEVDPPVDQPDPRVEYIAGLRALADLLEAKPDLPTPDTNDMYWHLFGYTGGSKLDLAAQKAEAARIVRLLGGTIDKYETGDLYRFKRHLHALKLEVIVDRPAVCERVVVSAEVVTKQVPDPNAPLVEVRETVEQVEWRCKPLLADDELAEVQS